MEKLRKKKVFRMLCCRTQADFVRKTTVLMMVLFFLSLISIIIIPVAILGDGSYSVLTKLMVYKENPEIWAEVPGDMNYNIKSNLVFP